MITDVIYGYFMTVLYPLPAVFARVIYEICIKCLPLSLILVLSKVELMDDAANLRIIIPAGTEYTPVWTGTYEDRCHSALDLQL